MKTQLTVAVLTALFSVVHIASAVDSADLLLNTDAEPDLAAEGFADLFNGKDLSGWSVKGGKMLFEVNDGVIVGTCVQKQPNGFLCTDKTYGNFVFTAEFRWEVLGNSGIMFRAGTKVQGTMQDRVFGYQSEMDDRERRYTGGIYGEAMGGWKYPLDKPKAHEAARAAIKDHMAWNRVTIQAQGNVCQTWVNGVPCAHLVNDERSKGFFGLQVHGGRQGTIHWRNIRIKELDTPTFEDTFAAGDFSLWSQVNGDPVGEGWSIADGIVHRGQERAGDIVTRQHYADFELAFEWKISEGGNSGVKYRTRGKAGIEYQILDDAKHKNGSNPLTCAASLYALFAAENKTLRPAGEWNTGRIIAKGTHVEHWLNGTEVMTAEIGSEEWQGRLQRSKFRGNKELGTGAGAILLQDHGDLVWYRNVRIREL